MRKHTFSRKRTRSTSRGLAGLGLPMIPGLRPHRAPVNPELARQHGHADPLRAGCSHSVHFAVCESCSRSFLWFRRRTDQRIVGVAVGPGTSTCALIPRGNKPLDPWSPVPAALHCFHQVVGPPVVDVVAEPGGTSRSLRGQCPTSPALFPGTADFRDKS